MAGHETRMLLLGAVAFFEPINGYQIRRELVSWQVDRWAHVNPGSIYHGLSRLAADGLLVRHDLVDAGREVAVYEISAAGREELRRLQRSSLEEVDPYDLTPFHTAFSMLPLLGQEEALASLRVRRTALAAVLGDFAAIDPTPPPHAGRAQDLWRRQSETELVWLDGVVEDLEAGRLSTDPSQWDWAPADDDPGWQMIRDRQRYRSLLHR